MRFGIAVFPGTWSDRDCAHAVELAGHEAVMLWHKDTGLRGTDCVVLPGGFSYGDYLRTGAIARFAPFMERVAEHADAGGFVLGICNGFQILCEAHLLPGALTRNAGLEFRCEMSHLRVETSATPYTTGISRARFCASRSPTARAATSPTSRRCTSSSRTSASSSATSPPTARPGDAQPERLAGDIAGIVNVGCNVLGMMPHPERACEPLLGSSDGMALFQAVASSAAHDGVFAKVH